MLCNDVMTPLSKTYAMWHGFSWHGFSWQTSLPSQAANAMDRSIRCKQAHTHRWGTEEHKRKKQRVRKSVVYVGKKG